MVNSLLEIAGLALLVVAAALVAIPLAVLVGGLELVLLANLREGRQSGQQSRPDDIRPERFTVRQPPPPTSEGKTDGRSRRLGFLPPRAKP